MPVGVGTSKPVGSGDPGKVAVGEGVALPEGVWLRTGVAAAGAVRVAVCSACAVGIGCICDPIDPLSPHPANNSSSAASRIPTIEMPAIRLVIRSLPSSAQPS